MKFASHNFNRIRPVIAMLAIAALLALAPQVGQKPFELVPSAQAATPNVAVGGAGVFLIPLHLSTTYSTTTTSVVKFNMPMPCDMIGVGAVPRALTGGVNSVDVKLGGTTILAAPMNMTAGTYTEGTITTSAIGDEGVITVDLNIPGSSSLTDTTVIMTCVRR